MLKHKGITKQILRAIVLQKIFLCPYKQFHLFFNFIEKERLFNS